MSQSNSNSEILTIPEVARFLRVAEKTVYGLVKRGELRAFRVGRAMRCQREEVSRFVASKEVSAATVDGEPAERSEG